MSDEGFVKIFFQSESSLFVLLTVSFALQKLLSFSRSHLFIVSLIVCATGDLLGSGLLCLDLVDYFPLSLLSGSKWSD